MTYGWAIIVILVVLAILYTLGVFTPGATLGNACSGNFKFTCSDALLSTNGTVSFDFGQNTGSIIYNLAFACTETKNSTGGPYAATSPWYYVGSNGQLLSTPTSGFSLESGRTIRLLGLPCFDQNGAALESGFMHRDVTSFAGTLNIGQRFTGILWVRYTIHPGTAGNEMNAWVQQQASVINAQAGATGGTIATSSTTVSGGTYSCSSFSTCEASQPGYACPGSCSTQCNATSNSNPACGGFGKYCKLNQIQCVSTTTTTTTTSTTTTIMGKCVAATPTSTYSSSVHYVPIELQNCQGTGTSTPFQQLIDVPSSSYSSYIDSGWDNIEFTVGGPYGTGSPLDAWIQTANNIALTTPVWVNMDSNSVPSGGNVIIYMNFMPSSVLSTSGPTGEAPQISGGYGQYDDGTLVFPFYDNFAGTSLDSNWQSVAQTAAVQNNGLTLSGPYAMVVSTASYAPGVFFEANMSSADNPGFAFVGEMVQYGDGYGTIYYNGGGGEEGGGVTGSWPDSSYGCCLGPSSETGWNSLGFVGGVYGVAWLGTGSQVYIIPESGLRSTSDTTLTIQNFYLALSADSGWDTGTAVFNWARTRAYPPGGVMPSVAFGSVV